MMKRLEKVKRKDAFTIEVDGAPVTAYPGETLAAVLMVAGKTAMRKTHLLQAPRNYYCGIGACNECLVATEDMNEVRACQTLAEPSMKIITFR